jgi:hypothetical protein
MLDQPPENLSSVEFTTILDDGAVIYVNGQEASRIGMDTGNVTSGTLANRTVNNAVVEGPFSIPNSFFVQGRNVVAVEVHQSAANSSDIVFGLDMEGIVTRQDVSFAGIRRLFDSLRITEVMFNPIGGSDFEFIEFQNVGPEPINLAGIRLAEAIDFTFPDFSLAPQQFVVVVNETANFQARYGTSVPVAGEFDGNLN